MAMKKGFSAEVVSQNIKEMMRAGHSPKQAVASALASKRKFKKMADGGMVSEDMDEGLDSNNEEQAQRSMAELQIEGESHPAEVMNPEYQDHEQMLAKALYKKAESEELVGYSQGGLVQDGPEADEPFGNKPEEEMVGEVSAPMSDVNRPAEEAHAALSESAMMALAEKKKKRRYFQ